MLETGELKSIGISIALILLNIGLMGALAFTPVADILGLVFQYSIVGIIFYGALLTGGNWLAEKGIERDDITKAFLGVLVLQLAYGSFGAGLLKGFTSNISFMTTALGVTAVVTTLIALVAGLLVYWTDRDFSSWNRYAGIFFIGVLVFGAIGTLWTPALLIAFLSALIGFMVYLVHEIWDMKSHPRKTWLNAVGIYVAYMGVFIQILQIILRLLNRE